MAGEFRTQCVGSIIGMRILAPAISLPTVTDLLPDQFFPCAYSLCFVSVAHGAVDVSNQGEVWRWHTEICVLRPKGEKG